jgi:hypothetical protein
MDNKILFTTCTYAAASHIGMANPVNIYAAAGRDLQQIRSSIAQQPAASHGLARSDIRP